MCSSPNKRYIVPNSLTGSLLYQVVNGDPTGGGTCESAPGVPLERMPPTPALALDAASIQRLKTWIMMGAPNN